MKVTCHRPSLATAFQIVNGVVPSRSPKEILKNVKLQLKDGKAILIGTDQEVGIRYEIPSVETDAAGEVLLPASHMISILRELQEEEIQFELTKELILIRTKHSEFRLAVVDPAEFPAVAEFEENQYFVVSAQSFREQIRRTVFATDVASTRYALGGVLMDFNLEKVTLAATDSRRLAIATAACRLEGVKNSEKKTPVIPSKAMSLIERSITDDQEETQIAVHANDALVKCGSSTIYCRLLEGRFPAYADVVPKEFQVTVSLVVGPFYAAVRQAQIVTNEESRGVEFTLSAGLLTMNSTATDVGQSKIELPISYDAEELTVTFDPRLIAEFLRVLPAETNLKLQLIDAESAAVLSTDDAYTYVIMPLSRDR